MEENINFTKLTLIIIYSFLVFVTHITNIYKYKSIINITLKR